MSECLNLQSRQAAEREALRLVEEKAMKFRKERDTALAKLERVQKARSVLELELHEHEKSCKNVHNLTWTLHYELLNCKADLSEVKVECAKIFALLEKKAAEAMAPDIPSADIVRPPRVNRAEKKNNSGGHKSNRGKIVVCLK